MVDCESALVWLDEERNGRVGGAFEKLRNDPGAEGFLR